LQGVDHGLRLIEVDGVGGKGLQDGGERLLDCSRGFDARWYFQVEVWVAGARVSHSRLTAGVVEVAVVLTAECRTAALVAVGHDAVAEGIVIVMFPPVGDLSPRRVGE
jgi:hypothetical protein